MSIGALLIGVALLVIIGVILADPWTRRRPRHAQSANAELNAGARREDGEGTLYALSSLDFDHQTGIINDSDYQPLRSRLLAEAASKLAAEDENRGGSQAQPEQTSLALPKEAPVNGRCPQCGTGIGSGHRFCSQCGSSLHGTCASCGSSVHGQDSFCSRCGEPINHPAGEIA